MSDELSVSAAVGGRLSLPDLRMDPETLRHQATQAAAHGNPQLAENLLRAAELVSIPDEELMALYEALRPHRSTADELDELAASLEQRGASRCASLVLDAGKVYKRRNLLR
jgi:propanediol dehydratase small subunit